LQDPVYDLYSEELRKEKKRRRQRQIRNRVLLLVLVLACLVAGVFLYVRLAPSAKRMAAKDYFETMLRRSHEEAGTGQENTEAAVLAQDELAVMLQDHVVPFKARLQDGGVYLPYEMVRSEVTTRFYLDEERSLLLLTTADENLEIPFNEKVYVCADDGSERSFEREIALSDERGLYLSADFMMAQVNVEVASFEETSHVLVNYDWGTRPAAQMKKNEKARFAPGIKNVIVTDAKKDDTVYVLSREEKWSRVVTADGFIGYLPNKSMTQPEEIAFEREFDTSAYTSLRLDEKVNLVWHQIDQKSMNAGLVEDTKGMSGVNVISPTWFFLSDNEGNFDSFADASYVEKAHEMGLQVWGLVSNFSPDMSTAVLVASTAARRNLAKNLTDAALAVGLDGINVDLEAIREEAGYGYVQFVRELSVLCRKHGLVLSIDVPVPYDFNRHYDRAELGQYVDYLIIMGYDEHYYGSEAGSVASLPFEENGVSATLESVPAEKIISGVPFYTRIWYTGTDGSVWSETLGMNTVTRTVESYDVTPVWNGETSQYYAQWTLDDGIECRIWIEDETSLAMKADLVNKYGLGGIAAWVLGNQRDTIWEVISRSMAGDASTVVAEQQQAIEAAQAAKEESERAAQEQAAKEESERAAREQAAKEESERAAQEQAAKEESERAAQEQAVKEESEKIHETEET